MRVISVVEASHEKSKRSDSRLEYPRSAFRLRLAIMRVSPILRKDRLIWHAINTRGKKTGARRSTFRDCSCSRSGASS